MKLRGGCYVADFRYDEGIRVREDAISPCLCSSKNGKDLSTSILLIEVINENQELNNNGLLGSISGGCFSIAFPDSQTRRGRVIENGNITPTLDTGCQVGTLEDEIKEIRIRKLTPRECFRLQGWTDDYFEKAEFVNNDSQLYKQAGNGVTVNVILAIAERLDRAIANQ